MNFQPVAFKALNKSKVCFYTVLNVDGTIKYANEYFSTFFSIEASGNLSFYDLVPTQEVEYLSTTLQELPGTTELKTIDLHLKTDCGRFTKTRWDIACTQEGLQTYYECIGIPVDVHHDFNDPHKSLVNNNANTNTGLELTSSEERYKLLFYNNPLPMWIYNVDTLQFIEVNEAAVDHYGYTREEFLSMTVTGIRPEEEIAGFLKHQKSKTTKFIGKGLWKHKKKNGEIIEVQITSHQMTLDGQITQLVLADDKTEQLKAQKKLLKSNERYNYASRATFDAIRYWDIKTGNVYWGDGFKMLFGYETENNQGDLSTWFNHIHPDEKERVVTGIYYALNNGATNWSDEYKYIKADGNYAYINDRGIIIRNQTGEATRVIGAMRDITISKLNEEQLKNINSQLLSQQKERELTSSILRSLSEKESLNDALQEILRKLTLFYNFEIGEAWLLNMDKSRMELRQKWSRSKEMEEFYTIHADINYKERTKGTLGTLWNDDEIIFIDDLQQYESFKRKEGAKKLELTKSLGVPIRFKGETIAIFSFFGTRDFADKEKMRLYLEGLSLQLALDLQRKKTEDELNNFFNLTPDLLCIVGFDGFFKKTNLAFENLLGYLPDEIPNMAFQDFLHPDDQAITAAKFEEIKEGHTVYYFENRYRTKDGSYKWLTWASVPLEEERIIYSAAKDVTEKKALDEQLDRVLESISDGFLTVNREWKVLYWNRRAEQLLGFKREQVLGQNVWKLFEKAVPLKFYSEYHHAFETNKPVHFEEFFEQYNIWFEVSAYPNENILSVFFKDVTERKKTEETIRLSSERYEVLAMATKDAIWDWNLTTGKVTWNEGLKTIFNHSGIEEVEDNDWWFNNLHPDDRERVTTSIRKHIDERIPNWQDEYRFRCADGSYKYVFDRGFTIYDNNRTPVRMIGSMQDLTETKASELNLIELNKSLEKRASELATSNEELERFAYVASHDLQEPLRMVSSFLQLIEKKFKDKLDQKAHEYIAFAVDGAERMKGLILDLLEYSRVNSKKAEKEAVDLNELATNLQSTYNRAIEQAKGKLVIDSLPVVQGNKVQLMQLFQNLVGNALKYKSDLPPEIFVRVKENESDYEFSIADNGIGIERRFFDKIFVIFQRLHNKNDYSGTGIGLAICKKIIELHAGNIWVESEPGKGSTFCFTLPKTTEVQIN